MLLKSLYLNRTDTYASKPTPQGRMTGKAEFWGNNGSEVSIAIGPEACREILKLCAAGLVEASQMVARDLTAEIIHGSTGALEAPGAPADRAVQDDDDHE